MSEKTFYYTHTQPEWATRPPSEMNLNLAKLYEAIHQLRQDLEHSKQDLQHCKRQVEILQTENRKLRKDAAIGARTLAHYASRYASEIEARHDAEESLREHVLREQSKDPARMPKSPQQPLEIPPPPPSPSSSAEIPVAPVVASQVAPAYARPVNHDADF